MRVLPPIASPEVLRTREMPPSHFTNVGRRLVEIGGVTVAASLLTLAFLSVPMTADYYNCPPGGCRFIFPDPSADWPVFLTGVASLACIVGVAIVIAGLAGAAYIRRTRPRPHA